MYGRTISLFKYLFITFLKRDDCVADLSAVGEVFIMALKNVFDVAHLFAKLRRFNVVKSHDIWALSEYLILRHSVRQVSSNLRPSRIA